MAMDDDPSITLQIPRPPTNAFDWDDYYIAVPADTVDYAIEVLRCYVAQWRAPEGIEPEDQTYNALVVAAAHALAGLIGAYASHNTQGGARQLVEQIASFFIWRDARDYLEALRGRQDTAYIVDALLGLYEESARRREAKAKQAQRAAQSQEPDLGV